LKIYKRKCLKKIGLKELRGLRGFRRLKKQYNNNDGCPSPSEEELSSSHFQSNLLLSNRVSWREKK